MEKELTTLFTGRQVIRLQSVESTNSYLAELLKYHDLSEGAVVMTQGQTSGRGQGGTRWSSDEGKNLLLSFVFFPVFLSLKDIFSLNKAFSLAVRDYLHGRLGAGIKIKWPNDIYWADKKVCGMLLENTINSTSINQSILGLGININQERFPDFLPNPVALKQVLGRELNLEYEFVLLCHHLESRYLQLRRGDAVRLHSDYVQSLYRYDEWCAYATDTEEFEAKIRGVDENGRLCLERKSGQTELFDMKEIRFVIS